MISILNLYFFYHPESIDENIGDGEAFQAAGICAYQQAWHGGHCGEGNRPNSSLGRPFSLQDAVTGVTVQGLPRDLLAEQFSNFPPAKKR